MGSKNIIDIDQRDFDKKVVDASENKLIIVDFWAPWCGPCKQLTPIMEKVASEYSDEFELVKINIDENKEIASQLRIQSIPTVYAFKDKKIVNAFQGVISEKDFIDFVEKSADKKLKEDMTEFYNDIKVLIDGKSFDGAKDKLLTFFSENKADPVAVSLYLECLLALRQFEEIDSFVSSLDEKIRSDKEIDKTIKKIKIVRESKNSESIDSLIEKFNENKHISYLKIVEKFIRSKKHHFTVNNLSKKREFLNLK